MSEQYRGAGDSAEELLRRALLDHEDAAAVAMRVEGLALCDELTIIFHGRRDMATIQTYVTLGARSSGDSVSGDELLRVPCDLDLADASDRDEAERLYRDQASALRDAVVAADTVLAVWREPLEDITAARIEVERRIADDLDAPAPRLIPVALRAAERRLSVVAVCNARTLAEGRPPLGIACIQAELSHVYPLTDDPEHALADFFERAADHAHHLADHLAHRDASVQRFLEMSGE
ncbi:MAG TPA: hypothetical protein VHX66_17190 [Solirubrobacteraceae bacterium]|nr:hypothetical protein [Solirubrobacteraceae bacterium]